VKKFAEAVDALKMGLPWEKDVKITPLPEMGKPAFLNELVQDAVQKVKKIPIPEINFPRAPKL
jgi:glyceraldehyde-3-phosphate dehydrogenase (NADP+)